MKRRFIAGAVCPRCAEMDKTVMYDTVEGVRVQECVRCGFRAELDAHGHTREPETRVNRPRPGRHPLPHEPGPPQAVPGQPGGEEQSGERPEDEVQVVKIVDPGLSRRDH